ncbi:hypothetical protein HRbin17_00018 [bacterium HR17]|uniref:Rod shape-determining protein MreD n=1 Tax=Candidatus Fervidibacter japonicus TaxID=2035412 RepID=A0A2H5X8M8_9BACT|nr:hypothetical protein HRbin17_00018 [bacterium HR17]
MRRWLTVIGGIGALVFAQTVVVPSVLPPDARPDLLLLATTLVGFMAPDGRALLLGLGCGFFQGWLHGAAEGTLALSRALAGGLASWLRARWLWAGVPAAAFCVGSAILVAELLQGTILSFAEGSLLPLRSNGKTVLVEVVVGAALGGIFFWWRHGKEE